MNDYDIDLNLLTVFEVLLAERSVTRAARRLGVTQPAMSNSLRRLRKLLDDPVFVRTSEGMSPTPRALTIGPQIIAALKGVRESINASGFDPTRSAAHFAVGTLDYLEALYLPALLKQIAGSGPDIQLRVQRLPTLFEVPQPALESGTLDCAIGLFPQPMTPQSSLHSRVLAHDDWVCVARRGHSAFRRRLSLQEYAALRHVAIIYPEANTGAGMVDRYLSAQGLTRNCPLALGHFMTAPFHVAQTDCVTTVPRRVADYFRRILPLQVAEVPIALPPINVGLVWHERVEGDSAHRWLRAMIKEVVQ
ncbi:MAG: LysR family transcriptional regulator [Proteobacteria bacterium]|nr:LysR family transcriptional regulator [Pseudomonadota bacterium]